MQAEELLVGLILVLAVIILTGCSDGTFEMQQAIAQRNAELAQQRAREHIENAEQTLLLEMEQLQHSR